MTFGAVLALYRDAVPVYAGSNRISPIVVRYLLQFSFPPPPGCYFILRLPLRPPTGCGEAGNRRPSVLGMISANLSFSCRSRVIPASAILASLSPCWDCAGACHRAGQRWLASRVALARGSRPGHYPHQHPYRPQVQAGQPLTPALENDLAGYAVEHLQNQIQCLDLVSTVVSMLSTVSASCRAQAGWAICCSSIHANCRPSSVTGAVSAGTMIEKSPAVIVLATSGSIGCLATTESQTWPAFQQYLDGQLPDRRLAPVRCRVGSRRTASICAMDWHPRVGGRAAARISCRYDNRTMTDAVCASAWSHYQKQQGLLWVDVYRRLE